MNAAAVPRWSRIGFVRVSIVLHLLAPVVLLVAWRHWPIVLTVIVVDHLALVWGSLWPRSRLVGRNVRRLDDLGVVAADGVALTFDDGPDPEVTPAVLEILERYGAQASFFCVGSRAEQHAGLIERIVAAGHRVENHTYRHPNTFCFFPTAALGDEIDRAQAIIAAQADRRPCHFRAPAGLRNPWLDTVLARRGLTLVSWTHRAFDTRNGDVADVVRRLAGSAVAGDILLLHDRGSAKAADGRPVVLQALPGILEELGRKKLAVRALPETGGDR